MTLLEAIAFAATFFIFCCLGAWRIFEYYLARLEKKIDEIIEKIGNSIVGQKPVEIVNYPSDVIEACMLRYLQSAANRKDDIEIVEDTKAFKKELLDIIKQIEKPAWSEDDDNMLNGIIERGSSQVPFGAMALRGEQIEWLMNLLKFHRQQLKKL